MPKSKPPGDFKHRTAKVGRKLAPSNETRIEVKFGSLDASRPPPPSPSSTSPHLQLRDALIHMSHHAEPQRLAALLQLRALASSSPLAVHASAGEALAALSARLVDEAPPVRALAAPLLAALLASLPHAAAASLLPAVASHLCAALARPHGATRLDAVGAAGALWASAPAPMSLALGPLLPGLVGLLEPQLHTAGGVASLAAAALPQCYGVGSLGGSGSGSGGGGGAAAQKCSGEGEQASSGLRATPRAAGRQGRAVWGWGGRWWSG